MMYTMYPFWVSSSKSEFRFTTDLNWVMTKDKNQVLIMVGWLKNEKQEGANALLLGQLRAKYDTLVYFDDNDGTECHFLDLLGYFDLYYKKQLFADRDKYLETFYGKRIYTDYYHKNMGAQEEPTPKPLPNLQNKDHLLKMKIGWNLAFGQYPASKLKTYLGTKVYPLLGHKGLSLFQGKFPGKNKPPVPALAKCHARFQIKTYRSTISYQRKLLLDSVKDSPLFLTGMVPQKQYNKEIQQVQATLSPFGWGELCFRDFEAILNGSIMIKPKMDHLETWPNLYRDGHSYISINWDGSDVVEKVAELLQDKDRMDFIRNNAWHDLKEAYASIQTRMDGMLTEIRELR